MKINAIKANGVEYDIWATESDVEALNNQGNAALGTEVESGKALIAQAINNVGGEASEDESLSELAEDIEQMPIVNVGCFKFSSAPNLVSIITKQTINTASTQWADQDFRDKLIEINDTEGVITSIHAYCFNNFPNLKKVNLPACTAIGSYVFQNCPSLKKVNLPACTAIGSYVFQNCPSLEEVYLPECVSIGSNSFYQSYQNLKIWETPKAKTIATSIFNANNSQQNFYNLNVERFLLQSLESKIKFSGSGAGLIGSWKVKELYHPNIDMTDGWFGFSYNYANFIELIKTEIPINYDFDLNLYSQIRWTASTYLTTSQDQWANRLTLYTNLLEHTIKKLYDHSQDGVNRTFRLGFYNTLYADSQLTTEPYGSYYTPLIKAMAAECIAECGRRNWTIQA